MNNGFLYLNVGFVYLARLAVSIHSLRTYYKGNITISCDKSSYDNCLKIAQMFNATVKLEEKLFEDKTYLKRGKFQVLKCRSIEYTPYDTTFFIDSDTIVLRSPEEVLQVADQFDFVTFQYSNRTAKYFRCIHMYNKWRDSGLSEDLIQEYINTNAPVITDGNFAFSKRSEWMKNWYSLTLSYISYSLPTETVLRLYIKNYKHKILGSAYNTNPRGRNYDKINRHTRIIHYYGSKHRMRAGKPVYTSNIWYCEFDKIRDQISEFIKYDPTLVECLPQWDAYKNIKPVGSI